jgi:hypothetical protein
VFGQLLMGDDGYYDWWADTTKGGCLPSHILKEIVEKLDELNFDWDLEIQNSFNTK